MSDQFTVATDTSDVDVYIVVTEGAVISGPVAEFEPGFPDSVHSGQPHEWREMLHYGKGGTGFAQCRCGAIGEPAP